MTSGDVSVSGVGARLAAHLSLFVSSVQGRGRRRSSGRRVQRRPVHAESLVRSWTSRSNFRLLFKKIVILFVRVGPKSLNRSGNQRLSFLNVYCQRLKHIIQKIESHLQ